MLENTLPLVLGAAIGLLLVGAGAFVARRQIGRAKNEAAALLAEARQDAEARHKEILVSAQEKALAQEEAFDRREKDIDGRESRLEQRQAKLNRDASEQGQLRKRIEEQAAEAERLLAKAKEDAASAAEERRQSRENLERVAGMTAADAKAELMASIERDARGEATRLTRRIEEEAREKAEREALHLVIQASQRVNIKEAAESTVSFIELPSDEMKGRIIGKEGRNIRAIELATGIDLVVDDTPRTILISSFDPVRREIARMAIDRLVEDGRIHPARIEEVVEKVREEMDALIESQGTEAAYGLGISDLHPRLARLVGRMRYHNGHGHNLLQHSIETALIAGYMAEEVGARAETTRRAGLLHEVGSVEEGAPGHHVLASADLCGKYGEPDEVVHAVRALHPNIQPRSVEALLLRAASRLSDSRPGARKDNLAVFIERLKRLENIATSFAGVKSAYAVKAGKEIRVLVDTAQTRDQHAYVLSKQIARAIEKEINYPGQVKVSVIRETRAVRYAV